MSPNERADALFPQRDDPAIREELVEMFLPLAHSLARRYIKSGQPIDDLNQVACLGLINAVDRFDETRGIAFTAYAIPTILGELKRYHRDRGWSVRVPRRLQENAAAVTNAVPVLCQDLSRTPTIPEIAAHTGLSDEEVLEAMEARDAYTSTSLDMTVRRDGGQETVADRLSTDDPAFETAEEWADMIPLLGELPSRERRIVALRFLESRTQAEIASEMGLSQMHISRLLTRALGSLRDSAEKAAAASAAD